MNLPIYIFSYFLILLSILGHGIIFKNIFFKNNNLSLGYIGILGILSLTVISYISTFFISHNLLFNSIIFLIGFFVIISFFYKNILILKKDLTIILFLFLILLVFVFTAKNHDDFPYYHFPYIDLLSSSIHDIGIGNFNHGFRTPSSIFYFASLFNLPLIKYDMVHIMPVFFLGFSNFIFFKKIKNHFLVKDNSFIVYLSIFNLALINIFFYRLAEHGTDRSAQILILLIATEILEALNYKSYKNYKLNLIFLMIVLAISLKVFYLIYILFLIPIFYLKKDNFKKMFNIFFNKITYFCIFFFSLLIFINFINTGCLIYPLSLTCFESISWSIPVNEVKDMNTWYQLWSKAGSTPTYIVENPEIYIQNFNWLNNWFNNYFLNKISDFLLGLLTLIILLTLIFKDKKINISKQNKKNYLLLYFIILFLFLEWFYNHPALRYGGYHLIALLLFIPFSMFIENISTYNSKKINTIITVIIIIFISRNFLRVSNEVEKYNYNFLISPSYNYQFKNFDIKNRIANIEDCTLNNLDKCEDETITSKIKFNRHIFYNKTK